MTAGSKAGSHGRRRLSKEELALWLQVTRTITPRSGVKAPDDPAPAPVPEAPSEAAAAPLVANRAGNPSKGPFKPQALPLAPIERRLRQRLSRGQVSVDMKIDLHGMRQDEAHSALRSFLFRARQNEAKLVLVVTGKGVNKASFEPFHGHEGGVLRRTVPHWLSAPELRHIVLGFEQAGQAHGGSGALYVRLRGKRLPGGPHL